MNEDEGLHKIWRQNVSLEDDEAVTGLGIFSRAASLSPGNGVPPPFAERREERKLLLTSALAR